MKYKLKNKEIELTDEEVKEIVEQNSKSNLSLEYGDQREREGREAGTKAWAVVTDDGFIATFNNLVGGKFNEVMQIHGNKKSVETAVAELVAEFGEGWRTQECRVVLRPLTQPPKEELKDNK